jgi:hypothetical protein
MAMKKFFFSYWSFSIRGGLEIRLWEDKWLGKATLQEQYPTLYNIVHHKSDTLAKVMETSSPDVSFRRSLIGPRQASWNALLHVIVRIMILLCDSTTLRSKLSGTIQQFCWVESKILRFWKLRFYDLWSYHKGSDSIQYHDSCNFTWIRSHLTQGSDEFWWISREWQIPGGFYV